MKLKILIPIFLLIALIFNHKFTQVYSNEIKVIIPFIEENVKSFYRDEVNKEIFSEIN